MSQYRLILPLLGIYLLPSTSFAGAILGGRVFADFNVNGQPQWLCNNKSGPPSNQPASCAGSASVPGADGLTFDYYASAYSAFGVFHGYAEGSISGNGQPGSGMSVYSVVSASSMYEDTITITSPGLDAQPGFEQLSYTVTGSSSANGLNQAAAAFQIGYYLLDGTVTWDSFIADANGVAISPKIPFLYGTPFVYQVNFYSIINLNDMVSGSAAKAAYADTAVLTGISISSNERTVSDFRITADSGTTYNSDGVVTPEPGTLALFCAGAAALVLARFRR